MKGLLKVIGLCMVIGLVMVLAVPLTAEEMAKPTAQAEKVNINKATAKELTQLKGIGPKLAERVVHYREEFGPFKKPEDIVKVPGIGEKTYEGIKEQIAVE